TPSYAWRSPSLHLCFSDAEGTEEIVSGGVASDWSKATRSRKSLTGSERVCVCVCMCECVCVCVCVHLKLETCVGVCVRGWGLSAVFGLTSGVQGLLGCHWHSSV